ncbi:MAG: transposase [candidate division WOR-3 bacterium]|nr:transposase [candidate division WOR-3 bacterium]
METEKKPRKTYTREYKIEAVRLTTEGGIHIAQVARDLGINENTLHTWRRQFRQWGAGPGAGKEALSQAKEIQRLRKDLARVREERDFLKKAAVWLAREAH